MNFASFMPPEDLAAYEKGAFGKLMGFGEKSVVLVVDMTNAFVDPKYKFAAGDAGWRAVDATRRLLAEARRVDIPVVYTKVAVSAHENPAEGSISRKVSVHDELMRPGASDIVDEIAPQHGDVVIEKRKASAFFGTLLQSVLTYWNTDTVIVTGLTTGGCIRATVVDAASYNYYVIIPEECVADRATLAHKVNLFDMHMKYADVLSVEETISHISKVKPGVMAQLS